MENNNSVEDRSTGSAAQQQPPGIDILQRLLDSIRDGDADTQRAAWVNLQDPNIMTCLAEDWQVHMEAMETLLFTVSSIRGQATRVRNLRTAIRNLSNSFVQRRTDRVLDELEENL